MEGRTPVCGFRCTATRSAISRFLSDNASFPSVLSACATACSHWSIDSPANTALRFVAGLPRNSSILARDSLVRCHTIRAEPQGALAAKRAAVDQTTRALAD